MRNDVTVRETIPAGCQPAPGYFLEVAEGGPWFRQDGTVTTEFAERGLWASISEAGIALNHFLHRKSPPATAGETPAAVSGEPAP